VGYCFGFVAVWLLLLSGCWRGIQLFQRLVGIGWGIHPSRWSSTSAPPTYRPPSVNLSGSDHLTCNNAYFRPVFFPLPSSDHSSEHLLVSCRDSLISNFSFGWKSELETVVLHPYDPLNKAKHQTSILPKFQLLILNTTTKLPSP
jgi:hypothetical protein